MTTAATLVAALLQTGSASANADDGMCDELGQMVEWTGPLALQSTVTSPSASPEPWSTPAEAARTTALEPPSVDLGSVAHQLPLEAEDILWCLSPDDPRCSPVDDGHGGAEVKVRDAANANVAGDVPGPFETKLSLRGSAGGGPRPAHGPSLERPPRA